jgi:hypothetical protein
MKLQSVFTAVTLCLLAIPAMAEDTTTLNDLMIPDNLGPKGRDGLAKFYGRPLVVDCKAIYGVWSSFQRQ